MTTTTQVPRKMPLLHMANTPRPPAHRGQAHLGAAMAAAAAAVAVAAAGEERREMEGSVNAAEKQQGMKAGLGVVRELVARVWEGLRRGWVLRAAGSHLVLR